MDLAPNQHFVYAWRYEDDTACKLGYSMTRTFYARIKAAKTVTYQDVELLGIKVFSTEAAARAAYQQRLKTFPKLEGRRAWVLLTDAVYEWLKTECLSNPPSLDAFKTAYQNDPVRREKAREYQSRSLQKRRASRSPRKKKRTEKDRAYEREYQRKRRESDSGYRERQRQRQKAWRMKHPEYDKNRYANDPEYAEERKAARRERYAKDPEYRVREKQRRKDWAQQHPDYKRKRREYMRAYRRRKQRETREAAEAE